MLNFFLSDRNTLVELIDTLENKVKEESRSTSPSESTCSGIKSEQCSRAETPIQCGDIKTEEQTAEAPSVRREVDENDGEIE